MGNLRLSNKRGFSLLESLIGFVLFSLMLLFYLPSFQLEISRMSELRRESLRWQLFYDLVRVVQKDTDYTTIIDNRIESSVEDIHSFNCQRDECRIVFGDGEMYEVKMHRIE